MYNALTEYSKGNLVPGIVVRGIKEGGVDIMYNPNNELLNSIASQEVLDKVEEVRQNIIDSKIEIPLTKEELDKIK